MGLNKAKRNIPVEKPRLLLFLKQFSQLSRAHQKELIAQLEESWELQWIHGHGAGENGANTL